MKTFALDLWLDLREKRLWPVAVVLLAGLVAVPVLLAKPVEDPGPPPAVSSAQPVEEEEDTRLAQVKLDEGEAANSGSTFGLFDPADPFKPPKKVRAAAEEDPGPASQAGPGDQAQATDSGPRPVPSRGDSGGDSFAIIVPPAPPTPPTPPSGGGGEPTPVAYTYVVDVTFTANGRTRRIKGLEKHDMLPGQASPLLISMGVTEDGGNAVFLVDASLEAAGEGRCTPSGRECELAYIGAGSEHVFTQDDGDTYTVRVDEIRKLEVNVGARGARAGKAEVARAGAADKLEDPGE